MSRRHQDGFSRRVPVQNSSGGRGSRCTLVLMSMAGWYHDCLGQSGIRRRTGALDMRSFLTTASMSSTGRQSSRVTSRYQCDASSLWHWRRRKTGCYPSDRRGKESTGAIILSTTEHRSVCLTARSSGEKRRDSHAILVEPWLRKDERRTRSLCSSVLVHQAQLFELAYLVAHELQLRRSVLAS
jgi:hypothetical protein